MVKWVQKRDKRRRKFKTENIVEAIKSSFLAVDGFIDEKAISIADDIANEIAELPYDRLNVEEIQDRIEQGLMSRERKDVAKAYILYRDERTRLRENTIDKTINELINGTSDYWNTENSNKNPKTVTCQRDYLAGIVSTDAAKRYLLPKDVADAHALGIIHEHDCDYMLQNTLTNCCLINLDDCLRNGTVINEVMIEPQHRLQTAITVATQIITAVASSQYGGCTINLSHLAPYVRMSKKEFEDKYEGMPDDIVAHLVDVDLKKCIKDAVQTFNYQVNSMSTTNGQSPFLSVFMYINDNEEYREETVMLIEEFFKQRIQGFKNRFGEWVTPAFPKLLYVLDENNIREDSEYWWLTKLAAECTSKRMVPDYISAKVMRELKGFTYGCMGCRSFPTVDRFSLTKGNLTKAKNFEDQKGNFYWGRFNVGVCTVSIPDVAFTAKKERRDFFDVLEERCELCHKGLRVRIDRLLNVTSDCAPILWRDGALARLESGSKLTDIIHNGVATASLGYVGLWEAVLSYTGHKLTEPEGKEFGLKVMQFLNDMCNKWKHEITDMAQAEVLEFNFDDEVDIDG